jgi:DNA repair exonuclease SbcCD nuclease subunit
MSQNKKVAIISDLHLGVHLNSPAWHDISLEWAKWLVNELTEKDITQIIFCGDFFHSRSEITVNTLHHASTILSIFKNFNIIMITGNHDSFYKNDSRVNSISILDGRPNITILDKPTLKQIHGKEVFFAPWGTGLNDLQNCDIMFGHFEIESFKMNTFKVCDEGFKSADLFKYTPVVVSGHFHLREERVYEKGTILYVGSPFELDFGDTGSTKGYYIMDFNNLKYEFFPNTISPQHIKVSLSDLIKLKDFKSEAKKLFSNNIVKLSIDKTIDSSDLEKITTKINTVTPLSLVVDHIATFDQLGKACQSEVDLSGVDISQAISDFVNLLDIQNKKEVIEYTVSLYNSCK